MRQERSPDAAGGNPAGFRNAVGKRSVAYNLSTREMIAKTSGGEWDRPKTAGQNEAEALFDALGSSKRRDKAKWVKFELRPDKEGGSEQLGNDEV
jgi:hypothetical protein